VLPDKPTNASPGADRERRAEWPNDAITAEEQADACQSQGNQEPREAVRLSPSAVLVIFTGQSRGISSSKTQ
jgi:hypothetical protein